MPLIFASNAVVSCPLALSWVRFDLTSLSFYSNETVLATVINDLSLTKLQGLFSILVCLSIVVFQSSNCSFLFDTWFLSWVRDSVFAWALSRVSIYLFKVEGSLQLYFQSITIYYTCGLNILPVANCLWYCSTSEILQTCSKSCSLNKEFFCDFKF